MGERYPKLRRGRRPKSGFLGQALAACATVFALTWTLAPQAGAAWSASRGAPREERAREPGRARDQGVYYRNCDEARAAGAAPLLRGRPGYRVQLDRDLDGIACEPYRGR